MIVQTSAPSAVFPKPASHFRLLDLPIEIRQTILLESTMCEQGKGLITALYTACYTLRCLVATNKQLRSESVWVLDQILKDELAWCTSKVEEVEMDFESTPAE